MIDFDPNKYSSAELENIMKIIDETINYRNNELFKNRVMEICDKLESLRTDYPWVNFGITFNCEHCDFTKTYNLFDLIERFYPEEFTF